MSKFGEWQPESTAPTNAAVLIYVEDWEHLWLSGVCRAIKASKDNGILCWHVCAWGIWRDVPMDQVRWWMPLPEPPSDGKATQDEQNMPAVLVRAAVSEFRRTGHWPCDVFERMVRWVDENTPPRWREWKEGKDGR